MPVLNADSSTFSSLAESLKLHNSHLVTHLESLSWPEETRMPVTGVRGPVTLNKHDTLLWLRSRAHSPSCNRCGHPKPGLSVYLKWSVWITPAKRRCLGWLPTHHDGGCQPGGRWASSGPETGHPPLPVPKTPGSREWDARCSGSCAPGVGDMADPCLSRGAKPISAPWSC